MGEQDRVIPPPPPEKRVIPPPPPMESVKKKELSNPYGAEYLEKDTPQESSLQDGGSQSKKYSSEFIVEIPDGTLAKKNNNPGNIRYAKQPGASQGDGGFARFDSVEDGFNEIIRQLNLDAGRDHTIGSFVTKYAPPFENDTESYIQYIEKETGYSRGDELNDVVIHELAKAIAKKESGTSVVKDNISDSPRGEINETPDNLERSVAEESVAASSSDNKKITNNYPNFIPDEAIIKSKTIGKAANFVLGETPSGLTMGDYRRVLHDQLMSDFQEKIKTGNLDINQVDLSVNQDLPVTDKEKRENKMNRELSEYYSKEPTSAEWIMANALDNSIVGMMMKIDEKVRYNADHTSPITPGYMLNNYSPNTAEEITAGLVSLVLDTPLFTLGGSAYTTGSRYILTSGARAAEKALLKQGVSKVVARKAAADMAKKIMSKPFNKAVTRVAQSAGALGVYDATRDVVSQLSNENKDFVDIDYGQTLKEFGKGNAIGASVGLIGYGTAAVNKFIDATIKGTTITDKVVRATSKVLSSGSGFATENAAFVMGGQLLDGKPLGDITSKDWIMSIATLGAMKAASLPARFRQSKNHKINTDEFKVEFEPEELKRMGLQSDANQKKVINEFKKSPELREAILNDPMVPHTAKAKIVWSLNGVQSELLPFAKTIEVEGLPDGAAILVGKNSIGEVVHARKYSVYEEASIDAINQMSIIDEVQKRHNASELTPSERYDVVEDMRKGNVDMDIVKSALEKSVEPFNRTPEEARELNKFDKSVDKVISEREPVISGKDEGGVAAEKEIIKPNKISDPVISGRKEPAITPEKEGVPTREEPEFTENMNEIIKISEKADKGELGGSEKESAKYRILNEFGNIDKRNDLSRTEKDILKELLNEEYNKIENYEPKAEAKTKKTTERAAEEGIKEPLSKEIKKRGSAIEEAEGLDVTFIDKDNSLGGKAVLIKESMPNGTEVFVAKYSNGEKSIVAQSGKGVFKDWEINLDKDGNPVSATSKDKTGNQITIRDSEFVEKQLGREVEKINITDAELEVEINNAKKEAKLISEKQTLYHGSKKDGVPKIEKVDKSYRKVLEVESDAIEHIKELAKNGDVGAKKAIENMKAKDAREWKVAEDFMKEKYGEYDAIRYDNKHIKGKDAEYMDIKENKFYSSTENGAKAYTITDRSKKYDTKNKQGVRSKEQGGKDSKQTIQDKKPGKKKAEGTGVVQDKKPRLIYEEGEAVLHTKLGEGVIKGVKGDIATIEFTDPVTGKKTTKRLDIRIAPLKKTAKKEKLFTELDVKDKTQYDKVIETLDRWDNELKNFGKEHMSMGLAVVAARAGVKATKVSIKAGKKVSDAINDGVKAIRDTDWYKGLKTEKEKLAAEEEFINNLNAAPKPKKTKTQKEIDKDVEGKAKGEKIAINNWVEFKRSLRERGVASRLGAKQAEKDITERREMVTEFIDQNKNDLKKLVGIKIPSILRSVNKAKTEKQINQVLDRLGYAIENQKLKDAKTEARKFIKKTEKIKTEKTTSGKKVAVGVLEEGVKYKDKVVDYAKLTEVEAEKATIEIEEKIGNLDPVKDKAKIDAHIEELALIDAFGDLENRSLADIERAVDIYDNKYDEYKSEFKKWRAESKKEIEGIADNLAGEMYGTSEHKNLVSGRGGKAIDEGKQQRVNDRFTKKFMASFGTIASMARRMNNTWRRGSKGHLPYDKTEWSRRVTDLRRGGSEKLKIENEKHTELKDKVKEVFGSFKEFKKELGYTNNLGTNKGGWHEIEFKPERVNKDGEKFTQPEKKILNNGTLAHMWASWKSPTNKRYMEKIGMTEEAFNMIDQVLPERLKYFTEWSMNEFLPEFYERANEVFKKNTGRTLPQLDGYLPINAKSWDLKQSSIDLDNVNIFKGFTKLRTGGEYNTSKNDIYDALTKHIEDHSSFVGLSEPISKFQGALNTKLVKNAASRIGGEIYRSTIIDKMNDGYTYRYPKTASDKLLASKAIGFVRRRFVQIKIRANLNLFPKQLTSWITAFDGDYGNPLGIAREMLLSPKETMKVGGEILNNSSQFGNRMYTAMESLTSKKDNIRVDMFGKGKKERAAGTLLTLLWNPTAVGDKVAIGMGGIPVAAYNYRTRLVENKKAGMNSKDAKSDASDFAMLKFEEFMNETQQSAVFTDISQLQSGGWKNATYFMNSPMAYARKVFGKANNISKGYKAKKVDYINKGDGELAASVKALKGISPKEINGLLTYTTYLPMLFATVSSAGTNLLKMGSEDDDERKKAIWDNVYQSTLGWTKGILGAGMMLEIAKNSLAGRKVYGTDDNFIKTFDDSFELINDLMTLINLSKESDELIKFKRQMKIDERKKILKGKAAIRGVSLLTGLPSVEGQRIFETFMDDDFDTRKKKAARIYGMPKDAIKYHFGD